MGAFHFVKQKGTTYEQSHERDLMDQIQVKLEASKSEGADKKAILSEINALQNQYETEKALFEAERDLLPEPQGD